jgi:glutathione synthase
VSVLDPNYLTIRRSRTSALVQKIIRQEKYPSNFPDFHHKLRFSQVMVPLSGFDVIFLRKNPPIDLTMLNFLDTLKNDTFIINDIDGLRKANNKLYPASFGDADSEIIPVTHVSRNKAFLKKAIMDCKKDRMILKPLDSHGGRGVIVVETRAQQNINSLLDFYIHRRRESSYVILQEYVEGAEKGDTRVLLLNGRPVGAYRRIPAKDDMRANLDAGASAHRHILTPQEERVCEKIRPRLLKDGLYLVGIDIISGKLIEINVISPGGIVKINQFNRTRIQREVIDFAEQVITQQKSLSVPHRTP